MVIWVKLSLRGVLTHDILKKVNVKVIYIYINDPSTSSLLVFFFVKSSGVLGEFPELMKSVFLVFSLRLTFLMQIFVRLSMIDSFPENLSQSPHIPWNAKDLIHLLQI